MDAARERMKRGVTRQGPKLPGAAEQRASMLQHHPDALLFELDTSSEGLRIFERLMLDLRRDDILVLHSLDILLGTTGDVAQTLRNLFELGVQVFVTGEPWNNLRIAADDTLIAVLTMLTEREQLGIQRSLPYSRIRNTGPRKRTLSVYQIEYARKLYSEGVSLRAIGLIFQVSPDEIWESVADPRTKRRGHIERPR